MVVTGFALAGMYVFDVNMHVFILKHTREYSTVGIKDL